MHTPPEEAYAVRATTLETLRVVGICLQPFIPSVAENLLHALGVDSKERNWENVGVGMRKESRGSARCETLLDACRPV
jgi:methionyl-tRNA synthetase